MSLTSLLLLSIPAALLAFKLGALALAAVYAIRSAVQPCGPMSAGRHQLVPVRSHSTRA